MLYSELFGSRLCQPERLLPASRMHPLPTKGDRSPCPTAPLHNHSLQRHPMTAHGQGDRPTQMPTQPLHPRPRDRLRHSGRLMPPPNYSQGDSTEARGHRVTHLRRGHCPLGGHCSGHSWEMIREMTPSWGHTLIYAQIFTLTHSYAHTRLHTHVFMLTSIHPHTCIDAYTFTYIHGHTHVLTHIHTLTYTPNYTHMPSHTQIPSHTHIHTHPHTHTQTHILTYTFTCTHTFTHTLTYTFAYTYI